MAQEKSSERGDNLAYDVLARLRVRELPSWRGEVGDPQSEMTERDVRWLERRIKMLDAAIAKAEVIALRIAAEVDQKKQSW